MREFKDIETSCTPAQGFPVQPAFLFSVFLQPFKNMLVGPVAIINCPIASVSIWSPLKDQGLGCIAPLNPSDYGKAVIETK